MANPYAIFAAATIAQVDTDTPGGTITAADVYKLTAVDEAGVQIVLISYTALTSPTATTVSAGLIAAWNASPLASAIATASGTATVILTAKNPGVPFYVTPSVTGVGTLTRAATVANSGPNDWNTAANWSTGAVPASTDNALIDGRLQSPILYGLSQSGVTLASLTTTTAVPSATPIGQAAYALSINATNAYINQPSPDGASRGGPSLINLNLLSHAATLTVYSSQSRGNGGQPCVQAAANNSATIVNLLGGNVGICTMTPGQAGLVGSISVGRGATVNLASGLVYTTCVNNGGNLTINGSGTTQTNAGGITTAQGVGTFTTVNQNGGTMIANNRPASGTLATTVNVNSASGIFDLSQGSPIFAFGLSVNVGVGALPIKYPAGASGAVSST